ncbi:bifunctional ADP-dependent NAD(P)H-hydrate dehydratase/NAD(P)H-hydrate epimerase [Salipaludibacillus keqinensis]|uniref:Bifunctional NAD(P)H-hydrate repair enzyme n=1 Tax=Salipaludibacillus keqinensis TaxID=2045207 RepID=A0A323THL7_9BACI|nr:NAD(P)H-hydrate dehydratase [Salipaludibacillus keqinensis]PYZ92113.1 bifunctional ADP-dependent NAD(P)H-hydrate dehydratase/NAD(P)H-hydrate epimerase [Salipaludibacillus keqinensis]
MYVVTGEEMRQIDRYTMDQIGMSEELLMENAGQAFVRHLVSSLSQSDDILVLIGAGNNGGDGFVIARLLLEQGFKVKTWVIPPEEHIKGTAKLHMNLYRHCGHPVSNYQTGEAQFSDELKDCSVVVDALLGTGIKGSLREPYVKVIEQVNKARKRVISVDIPSGLLASESGGERIGILADETYTLQAPKLSAFLYPGAGNYGELHILDIAIPKRSFEEVSPHRHLITEKKVQATLPQRLGHIHKGQAGRALVIGGADTMPGAPTLTTGACLRAGAGLVTTVIPSRIKYSVSQKITESTFLFLKDRDGEMTKKALEEDIPFEQFDGIAVGPGLGRKIAKSVHPLLYGFSGPAVIDADGLFHMSKELHLWSEKPRQSPTIITPHPGEMAMLTGCTIEEVEKRRFQCSREFALKYGVYVVLKGPFTIVTTPKGDQWVNTTGNASLAKGGSGDVLTGIILAFLLQHSTVTDAICNAVHIHGKLADKMLETHDIISVNASDLILTLPEVLKSYRY